MSENDTPTRTMQELTKSELITAIRTQAEAAKYIDPQEGSHALRNLAEAYAILTAPIVEY